MTTPHRTLQMALDALDAITDDVDGTGLNTMPSFDKALDAIAALREALAEPGPEPVAWKHDCATLCTNDVELWIDACPHCGKPRTAPPAAPAPAAPVPDGWVMAPREPTPEMRKAAADAWLDCGSKLILNKAAAAIRAAIAASPAAPAAPVVRELQDDLIESVIRDVAELDYTSLPDMPEVMLVTANELRGILQAHGITGGKP